MTSPSGSLTGALSIALLFWQGVVMGKDSALVLKLTLFSHY
jgi:hypothetical protein